MKATLPDGRIIEGSIVHMSEGYVSDNIQLEERDVRYMLHLLEHNPDYLRRTLLQLKNRYPVNRVGHREEKEGPYIYCEQGNSNCGSQTCGCVDNPVYRIKYWLAKRKREKRNG